jgi:hypothetical protein
VCLAGGATGAEYALVVHNGLRDNSGVSANGNIAVAVSGTGIQAPIAPPSPAVFGQTRPWTPTYAASGSNDGGFEQRLRQREHRELGSLVRGRAVIEPALQLDPAPAGTTINIVRIR